MSEEYSSVIVQGVCYMEKTTISYLVDDFYFYKKTKLKPGISSKFDLDKHYKINYEQYDKAKQFALEHPSTHRIKRTACGHRIIRETADSIKIANYSREGGLTYIEHINKKTGQSCCINTLGGLIKNFDITKKKHTLIQFKDFKDMLAYFRKNNPLEPSKLSILLKKIKTFI